MKKKLLIFGVAVMAIATIVSIKYTNDAFKSLKTFKFDEDECE